MNTTRFAVRLLVLLCSLCLLAGVAGCGNKGDLVRPGPAPQSNAG
jgi:predicted small lipoprotein YifL